MPLWGKRDQYSDAPKFTVDAGNGDTGQEQFGNTVYLADAAETSVADGLTNPGWVRRIAGTGPLTTLVIDDGGVDYANADVITVSGGTVNAVANVVTDANGTIIETDITNFGAGFTDVAGATLAITTSAGANAEISFTLGGRSGRVLYETIVAMSSGGITTDATDFANTSTANVANSTGTADDTVLPDS